MGKIEEAGSGLRKLSHGQLRKTRESLDDFIKKQSQLTVEFGSLIQWSQHDDIAAGKVAPVHELKRS